MRKEFLILLLLWGGAELSAQTIVQQVTALSQGANISPLELKEPTGKGNVLIAMPLVVTPGIRVVKVTDNAPDGANTYQQVKEASASCGNKFLDIWYCESCKPGVTELKFFLSDSAILSVNAFLEVSNLAWPSILDGSGAHVSDGTATGGGLEVGPSITTTAKDFIVARYSSTPPFPSGVTPAAWTHNPSYVYALNAPAGTYQPTLTGGKDGDNFCMGMAAFKTAAPVAGSPAGKN